MKKKPIVSVTYESERIHCYFCLPTSPELGFPVFPVSVYWSTYAMAN